MKIKPLFTLLFMVCLSFTASAQTNDGTDAGSAVGAQEVGTIRLGAGLVYGSKAGINDDLEAAGGVGINIGGEYFFTSNISAAPSFTYFFPSSANFEAFGQKYTMKMKVSSLNLDGRYYFNAGGMDLYGLAGLSVAFAGAEGESSNKTGVNLGGGVVYPLSDNLNFNGQIKYNTPLEQIAIQAGISFTIR